MRPSKDASAAAVPEVDLDEAHRFLDLLEPGGDFTFQTLDDRKAVEKPDPKLIKVLHGQFEEHAETLQKLNDRGAGVFVMVNQGDSVIHAGSKTCRSSKNVKRVRAVFVDLDGAPLEPVLAASPPPSIVVNSSPGRWHAYWRVSDCGLEAFTNIQKALIAKFDGDKSVHDLCRVMRIPGFVHRKETPFLTQIVAPARSQA